MMAGFLVLQTTSFGCWRLLPSALIGADYDPESCVLALSLEVQRAEPNPAAGSSAQGSGARLYQGAPKPSAQIPETGSTRMDCGSSSPDYQVSGYFQVF